MSEDKTQNTEQAQGEEVECCALLAAKDPIETAWEEYHGKIDLEDGDEPFCPPAPPVYKRGFVDGVDHSRAELLINIDTHHHSCADGCCDEYWDEITINGRNDGERFPSLCAESIEKVLNHLKIPHKFIHS